MVAKLAVDLLAEKTVPEILSLVAREIETTLGHVAFSPVKIENNEHCKASLHRCVHETCELCSERPSGRVLRWEPFFVLANQDFVF